MGFIERLKTSIIPKHYAASGGGASIDITHLTPEQVADAVKHRRHGEAFIRPSTWTHETECKWQEQVYVGKIARNIITLSKNTMASELRSDDDKIQQLCNSMARRVHLQSQLQKACIYYLKYGQAYIYPVYADAARRDLVRIKVLYSPSVKPYRDSEKEIAELVKELAAAGIKMPNVIPGTGDDVIGYVQKINGRTWFFMPHEIIFVARFPDGGRPNGYSILTQNADIISAKLQIEVDQTIMANRHGDPKYVFRIPAAWWDAPNLEKLKAFKDDMRQGIRSGMDFYVPDSDNADEKVDISILEATGNPQAVIKTQEHAENQFVAAFGLADSFTESNSSNRSVGEIQLAFFERDICADRIMWCEALEDELINPWLIANGHAAGSAWIEFADLTPDDRLQKLQILAPQFPYLPSSIVKQVLEQAGYVVDDDELDADPAPTSSLAASASLKRIGDHRTYSRLRGVPKGEAELIRYARDAVTEAAQYYRDTVKDQFSGKR